MPLPPRADEAGGLYHAFNHGNLRADIFKKEGDFVAFEQILFEGLQVHQVEIFSYQLMSIASLYVARVLRLDHSDSLRVLGGASSGYCLRLTGKRGWQ
jgi:hypothetical protein